MIKDEELDYRTAKEMAGYRITPDPDSRPGSDDEGPAPTPAASPVQEVPMRTPNQRRKTTYRAPEGSPPVRLGGPLSPVPPEQRPQAQSEQRPPSPPEVRPEPVQPDEEEEPEWVPKPFAAVVASLRQAKMQYLGMKEALEAINAKLGVEPRQMLEHIKALPKAQEMKDLRARIDCLLKKNTELKTQVADRDAKLKKAEALTSTTFDEKVRAHEEQEKAVTMAKKFHAFVGFLGDVVTKARLYDKSMKKLEVVPAPKVLRMLLDYSGKVEKLLGELCTLLQHGEQREEARPSESCPEPDPESVLRPEPVPPPMLPPSTPSTGGASAPTPQPGAPETRPEAATTPGIQDPTHQEPISDSLNTDDIPSLH